MASNEPGPVTVIIAADVQAIRDNWGWFLLLGLLQIGVGTAAILMANLATLASMIVIGFLALLSGCVQLASAIWGYGWSGSFQHVIVGVLYLVFGLIVVSRPVLAAEVFTLVLAALLLVGGAMKIAVSLAVRFHQWIWIFVSGMITLLLGIIIMSGWPGSSFWVIGTFIGVELLLTGWTWVILALGLRNIPKSDRL